MRRRLLAWAYTGPLGHLAAGVADIGEMFARYWWSQLRARRRGR